MNETRENKNPPKYFLCCGDGKIKLPTILETPEVLNSLLNYNGGSLSTFFRKNIRTFNSMFAFTSFGANIELSTKDSHGPYVFKISGQIHHLMGSLLPTDDERPRFAQLYIYDTENEVENKMSSFIFDETSKDLSQSIVQLLIEMLNQTNKLVKSFRMVKDRFKLPEIPSMKLRLIG